MFTSSQIEELKADLKNNMSEKRFIHTLGVYETSQFLASSILDCGIDIALAAALLHDISKEYPISKQLEILETNGFPLDSDDYLSPAVFHSYTAPFVINSTFPQFAVEDVLSAVRNHTIGSPDMSLIDEIVFLADFIEPTREYSSSIDVRDYVYSSMGKNRLENQKILHKASVMAIDFTIQHLIENRKPINYKNILTRNALLSKI